MPRRARKRNPSPLIGIALLFLFAVIAWYGVARLGWHLRQSAPAPVADNTQPAVDAANDGRRVTVSGKLSTPSAARDEQLGLNADAIVLLRNVEMYQWNEQCAGADCKYEMIWSSKAIDSSRFHTPAGHENPHFPFTSARFATGPVRLAGYVVDPDLIAEQLQPEKYPVHSADLPPNLAVTFHDADGDLITDDMAHPKLGALRVSYRVIPTRAATLTGVQHGKRLSLN